MAAHDQSFGADPILALRRSCGINMHSVTGGTGATVTTGDREETPGTDARSTRHGGPHRLSLVLFVVGCLLTALLAWGAASANTNNDHRLLKLQVRQAASTLSAALPSLQTPLTAAFDVAMATRDPGEFQKFIAPEVGRAGPFVSASLWQLAPGPPKPLIVVGTPPSLTDGQAAAYFSKVHPGGPLNIIRIRTSSPKLGYAEIPAGAGPSEAVYAESPLPTDKKAVVPKNSAFSDLDFALYLGHQDTTSALIETTGPLRGFQVSASVPFGDSALTLVGTASAPLGGGLSASLPWIAIVFGALLAVLVALTAEYLIRRRQLAEGLADENASLYVEQRTIAETLQHALLPAEISEIAGIETAVRYVPGVGGIEVGGDWYDVIPTGDASAIFVVGDVSGRGLSAATTMAYLRHAIRAYVVQGGGPAVVLDKLGNLIGPARDGHFATVLCGYIDVKHHLLTVACAGHFAPLVIDQDGAHYVQITVAPPIGVSPRNPPTETSITVTPGASVLAFTDGLVERRGESLDEGLARLSAAAAGYEGDMDDLLGKLVSDLTPEGSDDDIAILGVRWLR
jgi:serine phosphatase RsbU (regulator of sigma subunit)